MLDFRPSLSPSPIVFRPSFDSAALFDPGFPRVDFVAPGGIVFDGLGDFCCPLISFDWDRGCRLGLLETSSGDSDFSFPYN